MDWIKVTPETMPPIGVYVLVTAIYNRTGERRVIGETAYEEYWTGYGNKWFGPVGSQNDYWPLENEGYTVTHWMSYPEPAED